MSQRKIMSREEAFRYIAKIGEAVLRGEEPPAADLESLEYMEIQDLSDGMHAFTRRLAEQFDQIPAKISGDVAVQESLRKELDQAFAVAVHGIEQIVAQYQKE